MILTANEAAKLMPSHQDKSVEDICDQIKTLAQQGWQSALWELDKDQVRVFENLGYNVSGTATGSIYRISWK